MKLKKIFVMIPALVLILASSALGAAPKTVDEASAQEVTGGMSGKAVRGLANIATGWLELPKQVYLGAVKESSFKDTVASPLKGIGMAVVRTVSGVGELATFFLAVPGFYDPWIQPEFVWEKE